MISPGHPWLDTRLLKTIFFNSLPTHADQRVGWGFARFVTWCTRFAVHRPACVLYRCR